MPFSAPPTSQLVRGDQLPVSERRLLAILPLALHTSNLTGSSDDVSMTIQGSSFLYTPYAKLLLFGIANNFAGMEGLSYSDVWKFLKAKSGAELLEFLHQLPPSSQASRAVAEKLFQCAIEADDTAAVEILLESPEIGIDANKVVCRSLEYGRETALEFAASRGQIQMVGVLLRHRADVNKCIEPFVQQGDHIGGALARSVFWGSPGPPPGFLRHPSPPSPPPPPPPLGFPRHPSPPPPPGFPRYPPPLHHIRNAAEGQRLQLVDLLLRHGAIVDAPILRLALKYGSGLLERLLLNDRADHIEWAKSRMFHDAIAVMDNGAATRLCQVLVQNRLVLEILRKEPMESAYPLHFLDMAVLRTDISVAQTLLVEYDFPITETTLIYAVQSHGIELVQLLLERGAMVDPAPVITCRIRPRKSYEATPLSEAIRFKRAEIVKLLEEHGAFFQIKEATRYRAALVAAFQAGDFGMANRLLELHGPHTSEILGDGLIKAIRLNQDKLALRLLELGANPNTDERVNALSLALRKRKSKLIQALLDSPDIDLEAYSPLFEAVKRGDRSLLMELIMAGAPVNASAGLISPLILAVRANDRELVELLLGFGASVNFSAQGGVRRYDIRHAIDDSVSSNESEVDSGENNIDVDSGESEVDFAANNDVPLNKSEFNFGFENEVNYGENNVDFGGDDVYSDIDIDSDEDSVSSDESDVDPPPIRVMTPLIASVMNGDIDMILFLLSSGADPSDASALAEAVYMQNPEIMDVLLEKFHKSYPRGKADYGLEAMRIAVRRGDLPLVAKLLANGVGTPLISALEESVNWCDDWQTPFVEAIEQDGETGFAIFRMMLEAMIERNTAASLNAIVYRRRWDSGHGIGKLENETALLVAIKAQNFDKVQLLVEKGADVNRPTVHGVRRTPLQKAAEVGDFRIAEYLINRGADVNVPAAGSGGATALQFACIYGYAGIVDLLLRNGADPDAAPARSEGRTALEGAAEHGRLDTVAMLLNAGVKVGDDHRPQFERAVERAQEAGHFAVVDLLVRESRLRQERGPRSSNEGGNCLVTSEKGFGEEFIYWES
jgi:ankyrin repeat protein